MAFTMVTKDERFVQEKLRTDGTTGASYRYFGAVEDKSDHPQAFIVTLQNKSLQAHFHPVDQFQILLGGPGALYQRTPVPDMMLHYADAYSTYGPFCGEDPPLRLLTLRAHRSAFTAKMPQMREKLLWRGKRLFHEQIAFLQPSDLPGRGVEKVEVIWPKADDNHEAFMVSAGPETVISLPGTDNTDGQYVYVADGSIVYEGKICDQESLAWHDRDSEGLDVTAGPQGTRIFVMRFPSPTTSERHAADAAMGAFTTSSL